MYIVIYKVYMYIYTCVFFVRQITTDNQARYNSRRMRAANYTSELLF